MPLSKGKSQKSFVKNLKHEMEEGHPQKQALAIAYSMKRKAKKMADGGSTDMEKAQQSLNKAFGNAQAETAPSPSPTAKPVYDYGSKSWVYPKAQGGFIEEEKASGYLDHEGNTQRPNGPAMTEEEKKLNQHKVDMHSETSQLEQDLVNRIMNRKSKDFAADCRLAEGGEIGSGKNRHNYEKGIHKESFTRPESTSNANEGLRMHKAAFKSGKEAYLNKVKNEHHKVLEESREMPNPKLQGLYEGGYADASPGDGPYEDDEQGLVDRIMRKHSMDYSDEARLSEGGKVANNAHEFEYEFETPDEFDDLVLRDDLKSTYGEDDNSGDSLDNDQENEDRKDIVARIMASRRKKDKLPSPA